MGLSATIIAKASFGSKTALTYPTSVEDSFSTSSGCGSDAWLFAVAVGAYSRKNSDGTPYANPFYFDSLVNASMKGQVHEPTPSGSFVGGVGEYFLAGKEDDDTYPNMSYSRPGNLTTTISTSDTMKIQWLGPTSPTVAVDLDPYVVAVYAITGSQFSEAGSFGSPTWVDEVSINNTSSSVSYVNGTSGFLESSAGQFTSDPAKGTISLGVFAWDDVSQTPSLSFGWDNLGTFQDNSLGWKAMVVGKEAPAGDVGPYTVTATFSSTVKMTGAMDVWMEETNSTLAFDGGWTHRVDA